MKIPFLVLAATCLLNVFVTGQDTTDITFTCPGSGFYPYSDECSQFYYYCDDNAVPSLEVCPGSAVYDPILIQCTDINSACCNPSVTCPVTTPIPFTCPGNDGFYPFSDECSQFYYYCDENGLPSLEVCPGSAVYDPIYVQCTDIDTACCNPLTTAVCTTTPPDETTITDITTDFDTTTDFSTITTDFDTTTDFSSTTDSSTTTQLTTTTTRTTGNPGEFTCPQPSGNFPYEGDCTKYWACSNGTPYEMNCPASLVFNPRKGVCDYVSNVPECQ